MLLYNRFCEVQIGDLLLGGCIETNGVEIIEPINIGFRVQHTLTRTPNEAEIIVYNPSPDTQKEIEQEGLEVIIKAGYKNQRDEYIGVIFKGKTRRSTTKIENQKNIVTRIWAGDADDAFKYSRVKKTLPAGENDPLAITEEIAEILKSNGVEIGEIRIEGPPDVRATTLDRPVRYELDDLCRRYECHWMIHQNVFHVWPKAEAVEPEPVLELSSETGLIDAPEKTESGVRIRTMMLWELMPGFLFNLKPYDGRASRELEGLYRIESITFSGELLTGNFTADIEARLFESEVKRSRNRFAGEGG